MSTGINTAEHVFMLCILCGGMSGLAFDIFRIIRENLTNLFLKNFCDAAFWMLYGIFFAGWIFKVYDGQLRWFVFAGIIMGATIYFAFLSKIFLYIGRSIVMLCINVILFVFKLVQKPIKFILRKSMKIMILAVAPVRKIKRMYKLRCRAEGRGFFAKKLKKIEKNTLQ